MDEEKTMLSALLANLDDIENQLKLRTTEHIWKSCSFPKEIYRSFTNIKNVLNSLVKSTIRDVNNRNEVKSINQTNNIGDKQSDSQSLISSDEYLAEIKNLLVLTLKEDVLHNYLLNFQDLLGDLLYSICQINSHHLKFPSRITVDDLEKLQKYYISISESLAVSINNCATNGTQHLTKENGVNESKMKIEELHKLLQSCLKEMSKVKLEIDHYYKSKMMEMQFEQNISEQYAQLKGSVEENTNHKFISNVDRSIPEKCVLPNNNKSNTFCNLGERKNILNKQMNKIVNSASSKRFNIVSQKLKEDKKSSVFHSSNKTAWIKDDDSNSSENFFDPPLLFSDLLFLEAKRVALDADKKTLRCRSLPKIYSLESITEETETDNSIYKKDNMLTQESRTDNNNSQCDDSNKFSGIGNEQNSSGLTAEDLFDDDNIFQMDEPLAMNVKAKISSLFSLLRHNQLSNEDLFKDGLQRSENTYLLNSLRERKLTDLDSDEHNNFRSSDDSQKNKSNNDEFRFKQNKKDEGHKYVVWQQPLKCNGKEEISSKTSLVELFKPTDLTSNTDFRHMEGSTISTWPVKAKYINVSAGKRISHNGSYHSDHSTSLGKDFEKGLYAIHLNKRFEEKQIYDKNVIVLENTKSLAKENSDYSSVVLFDVNHCEVNTNKFNPDYQRENNIMSHFSTLKSNPPLLYPISILPNMKESFDLDKTMTVQFAQCRGVPYVAKQENFQRRNFDFLNLDGCNNVNWNSFISIYTSKMGRSTQINQHRMFGKIINNVGANQKQKNRLFDNVHTLTSNGGPFRLFDINGYPLTDSAGNVLKDPYGKSLVQLDSTGFPKNDINVYDAAGNTPDDINFDPTQKPKTNSIIIKLTDHFKSPLHLFDKYGRPLTDATGNLLVNIHGRPLLRFDNFGRPNTDYRGGPLYTDEGCKWSYKTGQSLSSDQFSEETARKMATDLINKCGSSTSIIVNLKEKCNVLDENKYEDYTSERQKDKFKLKTKDSDMWAKVENVLQHLPKRKIFETKTSETNVLVTKNCGELKAVEDILKPIIHHNNIIQRKNCNYVGYTNIGNGTLKSSLHNFMNDTYFKFNNNFENEKTCLYFEKYFKNHNTTTYEKNPNEIHSIESKIKNNNLTDHEINLINTVRMTETPMPSLASNSPFYNDVLNKDTCSKCLVYKTLFNPYKPTCIHFNQTNKKRLQEGDCSFNYDLMTTSTCNPKYCLDRKMSNTTFKKHDYLNNLCNEILKYQLEYKDKVRIPGHQFLNDKKEKWTDTSFTMFTSSDDSKYTSEFPTTTETPNVSNGSTVSNLIKIQNHHKNVSYPYKRHDESKSLTKRIKPCDQFLNSKHNQKASKNKKDNDKNISSSYPNDENVSLESDDTALSINVLNQGNEHYEINVSEKKANTDKQEKCLNKKLSPTNHTSNKKVSNNEQQKVVQDVPSKLATKQDCTTNRENNHSSKTSPESGPDSPFRFNSETNIESLTSANDQLLEIKYVRGQPNQVKSNMFIDKDNKSRNNRLLSHNYKNKNIKYTTLTEKEILEEYGMNYVEPCQKILSDTKLNRLSRKKGNPFRRHAPTSKDCNIVTFLGNPVKYVLNKIDNTFPSRQNNINKINNVVSRPNKDITKENEVKPDCVTDSSSNYKNSINIKSKTNCKNVQEKFKHIDGQVNHCLLALQSKSCVELTNQDYCFTMNYSGNENEPQNLGNGKVTSKDIVPSSTKIRKCSSTNCLVSARRIDNSYNLFKRSTKYHFNNGKQRNEQSIIKQNALRKINPSPHRKIINASKETKKHTPTKHKKPCEETKKSHDDTLKKNVGKSKQRK